VANNPIHFAKEVRRSQWAHWAATEAVVRYRGGDRPDHVVLATGGGLVLALPASDRLVTSILV
jgi:hypothetical protein